MDQNELAPNNSMWQNSRESSITCKEHTQRRQKKYHARLYLGIAQRDAVTIHRSQGRMPFVQSWNWSYKRVPTCALALLTIRRARLATSESLAPNMRRFLNMVRAASPMYSKQGNSDWAGGIQVGARGWRGKGAAVTHELQLFCR